jgi:hypothetical protein
MAGQNATTARTFADGQIISCPDVKSALPALPQETTQEATQEGGTNARQEAEAAIQSALQKIKSAGDEAESKARLAVQGGQGPDVIKENVVKPLEDLRSRAIAEIADAIGTVADRPTGLENLAGPCNLASLPPAQPTPSDQQNRAPGTGF